MPIAIFYNAKTNPRNKKYAEEVAAAFRKHQISPLINPPAKQFRRIDVAIAVGGDGTVLYVANLLAKFQIPILGINFGHRGYLCQAPSADLASAVERLVRKDYTISAKTRIQARIQRPRRPAAILEALNEISIGGIVRTVHLDVEIKTPDRLLRTKITGDGLIIASETGSTAYNINAGGPLLLTAAFSVVASNAFFESEQLLPVTRSIVIPTEATLRIRDLSQKVANLPFVIADGQNAIRIGKEDTITIERSMNPSNFICL